MRRHDFYFVLFILSRSSWINWISVRLKKVKDCANVECGGIFRQNLRNAQKYVMHAGKVCD